MADSLEEIFATAIELGSSDERIAYLNVACGGDPSLRGQVERMLVAYVKSGSFLESPALEIAATALQEAAEQPGTTIGRYKLVEELAEGGMGIVYLAEQQQPVRRKVALKIVKPGMDTREVIRRFEAERQALAMMDHPNIAKVFDAGETESGRSYFVMELVNGIPLTEYCDRHELPVRERLELFVPVCQAVHHAHQKGIIHRDIKPSNVMVALYDGRAVPKVIDFGIAKALDARLTERTLFTHFGQMVGTPLYMSPEQAEAGQLDVDTRSDVYSLGVMLYELLTGSTPYDGERVKNSGYDEIRRMIREDEPLRPSGRISTLGATATAVSAHRKCNPARLSGILRRDLDWIVMKALEKDRTRRYQTASDFARDIERYLAGEAVEAGPPGTFYRAGKFARRFRVPLMIAAGFAGLLAAITIMAVSGYYYEAKLRADTETARGQLEKALDEAKIARNRALTEAQNAKHNLKLARDAVQKYYIQVADDPRLKPHNLENLRRDLLQSANEFYEKVSDEEAKDPDLLDEGTRAYVARGRIEAAIGHWPEAEDAYNKALAAATHLAKTDPNNIGYQAHVALIRRLLGVCYRKTGRIQEAEAVEKEAVAIWNGLVNKYPEAEYYNHGLGVVYMDAGRFKEAEAALKKAIVAFERPLVENQRDDPELQGLLADCYHDLGVLYIVTGRNKEAEEIFEESLTLTNILVGKHPQEPRNQELLARLYYHLGSLSMGAGRTRQAEAAYKESLAILQSLAEKHPGVFQYQSAVAVGYRSLGIVYAATGRAQEAEAAYKEALSLQKTLAHKEPEVPDHQYGLAECYHNLGILYRDAGRNEEAESAFGAALGIGEILVKKHPADFEYQNGLASSSENAGILYWDTGRKKEAEAALVRALAIEKTLVEKHPEAIGYQWRLATIYSNLGIFYERTGRPREAVAACQSARAILDPLEDGTRDISDCLLVRSSTYYNLACFCAASLAERNNLAGAGAEQLEKHANALTGDALQYLRRAFERGYFDNPQFLDRMERENDLAALRERPEYKHLREEIAARANATSRLKPMTKRELDVAIRSARLAARLVENGDVRIQAARLALDAEDREVLTASLAKLAAGPQSQAVAQVRELLEGATRHLALKGNPVQIEGKAFDGTKFDWSAYRDKVVLIAFWDHAADSCQRELRHAELLRSLYRDRGFDVVAISMDRNRDDLSKFLAKEKVPWVTLRDDSGDGWHPLATYYGVLKSPTMLVVDKQGRVLLWQGGGDELDRLLNRVIGPAYQPTGQLASIDLQPRANLRLTDCFDAGERLNNLAELRQGEQILSGVKFAIGKSLIQLDSEYLPQELRKEKTDAIPINKKFTRLYILHGKKGNSADDGTPIAEYRLHYEDGTGATIPVVLGEDVRDWWNLDDSKAVTRGIVAWDGNNGASRKANLRLRLYLAAWDNPRPETRIVSIDFVRVGPTNIDPFCVAITAEETATGSTPLPRPLQADRMPTNAAQTPQEQIKSHRN
jgi:eukaryotic-like serine/threonine-protein kinase